MVLAINRTRIEVKMAGIIVVDARGMLARHQAACMQAGQPYGAGDFKKNQDTAQAHCGMTPDAIPLRHGYPDGLRISTRYRDRIAATRQENNGPDLLSSSPEIGLKKCLAKKSPWHLQEVQAAPAARNQRPVNTELCMHRLMSGKDGCNQAGEEAGCRTGFTCRLRTC